MFKAFLLILLGILGVVFISSISTAENARHVLPTNNIETIVARISVDTGSGAVTLLDLHRAATHRLLRKYERFEIYYRGSQPEALVPEIEIETSNIDRCFRLTYGGGISNKAWSVYFDKSGKIRGDWEGLSIPK